MSDLIERQAAIDVLAAMQGRCTSKAALIQNSKIWQQIKDLPSVQPVAKDINVSCKDAIDRQVVIDALEKVAELFPWRVPGKSDTYDSYNEAWNDAIGRAEMEIEKLPSVHPEPISDVYMKAVWTWLLDYQIKAAELKGRYTPYEVLSWVANDWRKEHERSD